MAALKLAVIGMRRFDGWMDSYFRFQMLYLEIWLSILYGGNILVKHNKREAVVTPLSSMAMGLITIWENKLISAPVIRQSPMMTTRCVFNMGR